MKLKETAEYLKSKKMSRTTKNNSPPEGSIYEQFAYLPKLVVYTNSSDMNPLSEIQHRRNKCNHKYNIMG